MASDVLVENNSATKQNFASDQDVRWCPGCGDYAILAQMKKILPETGVPREKTVFISGIGCASRFPYYLNTYGMHTIHGRAPTVATGVKLANPELSVWIISGDGDGFSIGASHLLHLCRRNVDVKIVLFNNQIYGLTKGQYSPTSPVGKITKTTPFGSLDMPFNPLAMVLAAGATFVARTVDRDTKHMAEVFRRAAGHRGTAFVEVYQNCNIFNDGAYRYLTDPDQKAENILYLKDDQPLRFGLNQDKVVCANRDMTLEAAQVDGDVLPEAALIHKENQPLPAIASLLAGMEHANGMPTPVGVFRAVEEETYDRAFRQQMQLVEQQKGTGDLKELLHKGDTWQVL